MGMRRRVANKPTDRIAAVRCSTSAACRSLTGTLCGSLTRKISPCSINTSTTHELGISPPSRLKARRHAPTPPQKGNPDAHLCFPPALHPHPWRRPRAGRFSVTEKKEKMETSADKALRMPELVACVLRCLGPLDWLKCAAVCSSWSVAILDGGEPRTPDSRPSSSPEAEGDGKGSTRERDREAGTTNLWRDFAVAEMRYDPAGGGSSDRGGGACNGGRSTAPVGRAFYRSVCLEGDPEVLGPPLAVTSGEDAEAGSVALVRIGEVAAAAFARSRKPRCVGVFGSPIALCVVRRALLWVFFCCRQEADFFVVEACGAFCVRLTSG